MWQQSCCATDVLRATGPTIRKCTAGERASQGSVHPSTRCDGQRVAGLRPPGTASQTRTRSPDRGVRARSQLARHFAAGSPCIHPHEYRQSMNTDSQLGNRPLVPETSRGSGMEQFENATLYLAEASSHRYHRAKRSGSRQTRCCRSSSSAGTSSPAVRSAGRSYTISISLAGRPTVRWLRFARVFSAQSPARRRRHRAGRNLRQR
jgi:hypothetical protein